MSEAIGVALPEMHELDPIDAELLQTITRRGRSWFDTIAGLRSDIPRDELYARIQRLREAGHVDTIMGIDDTTYQTLEVWPV